MEKVVTKCFKCRKPLTRSELHPHHIIYKPPVIKPLCEECHLRVSTLNYYRVRKLHRKLKNQDRADVWNQFMKEPVGGPVTKRVIELFSKPLKEEEDEGIVKQVSPPSKPSAQRELSAQMRIVLERLSIAC